MEKFYTISDAAKQLSVETHVLRYWEDELNLHIHRNAQGHRFYVNSDITLLHHIKDLKDQGFQLKAIKLILPDIKNVRTLDSQKLYRLREELNAKVLADAITSPKEHSAQVMPLHPNTPGYLSDTAVPDNSYYSDESPAKNADQKLRHFETMMQQMISSTLVECTQETENRISEKVSTRILKEVDYIQRQREELQEQQLSLLQQILTEVRQELPETASSSESSIHPLKSKNKPKEKAKNRKKLFAKSH